jgi:hypothetical protein
MLSLGCRAQALAGALSDIHPMAVNPSDPTRHHARALDVVAKSQLSLKAQVFKLICIRWQVIESERVALRSAAAFSL